MKTQSNVNQETPQLNENFRIKFNFEEFDLAKLYDEHMNSLVYIIVYAAMTIFFHRIFNVLNKLYFNRTDQFKSPV